MNKPPLWFAIVAFAVLRWNLLGRLALVSVLPVPQKAIAQTPEETQMLYEVRPK